MIFLHRVTCEFCKKLILWVSFCPTRLDNAFIYLNFRYVSTEKEYGKGAVLAFFQNRQLFSTATITKLDRESDCHETTEQINCTVNAKYRRSDGRCSNLNFPLAGAAGTPYIRLLPAVRSQINDLSDM